MKHNENIFHSKISTLFPFLNEEDFPEFDEIKKLQLIQEFHQVKLSL